MHAMWTDREEPCDGCCRPGSIVSLVSRAVREELRLRPMYSYIRCVEKMLRPHCASGVAEIGTAAAPLDHHPSRTHSSLDLLALSTVKVL